MRRFHYATSWSADKTSLEHRNDVAASWFRHPIQAVFLAGSRNAPLAAGVATGMGIDRVVVLHGYAATPEDHWFGWLAEELGARGIDVAVPALPQSDAPDREVWTRAAQQAVGELSLSTAVVGHSLGAITALRALSDLNGELGVFVAVAGFAEPLPSLPELDSFIQDGFDATHVWPRLRDRFVMLSDNDEIVPATHTLSLGRALRAEAIQVPRAGQFLAAEGVADLPTILPLLLG